MKHLKTKSSDLRRLFERAISVREIAEPLVSFDAEREAQAIREFMERRNFDVVGVREDGVVVGYVRREELGSGTLADAVIRFREKEKLLNESDSLLDAIQALRGKSELFVNVLGQPGAIVTKGDLQKSPVRLWLFGIISLIEMRMLWLIRDRFADGGWKQLLTKGRLNAAQKIFEDRRRRNLETEILDCLQISDKKTIFLKEPWLSIAAGFSSKVAAEKFFAFLESLRNDLAHSNDILKGRWPELADRLSECERLLIRLESAA